MGLRRDELFKIVANQRRAESPDSRVELKLSAVLGTPFAQCPGDKQEMTHEKDEKVGRPLEIAGLVVLRKSGRTTGRLSAPLWQPRRTNISDTVPGPSLSKIGR